jgi:hypothetical protein
VSRDIQSVTDAPGFVETGAIQVTAGQKTLEAPFSRP